MQDTDPTQHMMKILLYFLVFLRYIELRMAPIVPNMMRPIAAIEISRSEAPKGFMRRLALEANVWKLP